MDGWMDGWTEGTGSHTDLHQMGTYKHLEWQKICLCALFFKPSTLIGPIVHSST